MTDSQEQKAAFAAFLFENPAAPLEAACKLYPNKNDIGIASYIAMNWPYDEYVMQLLDEKRKNYVEPVGLELSDMLKILTDIANDNNAMRKDRIAAVRTIAELKGIGKNNGEDGDLPEMPRQPVYKIVRA